MMIAAISISWVSTTVTQNNLDELSRMLEIAYYSGQNISEQSLEEIYKKWEKCSMLLHLFVNNNSISKLENNMDSLRYYAASQNLLFKENCVNAITTINEISEIEKVTFKNIF